MKKIVIFLILIMVFSACKKEGTGTMNFKIHYTDSPDKAKSGYKNDTYYTGFGDYITSLTPHRFLGKFGMLGFRTNYMDPNIKEHTLLFIDGNMSDDDPAKIADFSNNAVVSYSPDLSGLMDDHFRFVGEQIELVYFFYDLLNFYQEVNIPAQYEGVDVQMFNYVYGNYNCRLDSIMENNIMYVEHFPFIARLFVTSNGWPNFFVFGNCDSTFVFNTEGNEVSANSLHFPFGGSTRSQIIRSNNYFPIVVNTPYENETVNFIATMSFDTRNLIQIYAGEDNLPYTGDDVFIYAPNFWERIKVIVEIR